jgi:hypothetical protein
MNGDYDILRNKIPFPAVAAGVAAGLVMAISACAQVDSAVTAPASEEGRPVKPVQPKDKLPYAGGRQFRTLDEYLAYRRTLGATDRPWYDEISPGVYKLTGGRRLPGSPEPTYTRRELLEKFGFSQ